MTQVENRILCTPSSCKLSRSIALTLVAALTARAAIRLPAGEELRGVIAELDGAPVYACLDSLPPRSVIEVRVSHSASVPATIKLQGLTRRPASARPSARRELLDTEKLVIRTDEDGRVVSPPLDALPEDAVVSAAPWAANCLDWVGITAHSRSPKADGSASPPVRFSIIADPLLGGAVPGTAALVVPAIAGVVAAVMMVVLPWVLTGTDSPWAQAARRLRTLIMTAPHADRSR